MKAADYVARTAVKVLIVAAVAVGVVRGIALAVDDHSDLGLLIAIALASLGVAGCVYVPVSFVTSHKRFVAQSRANNTWKEKL